MRAPGSKYARLDKTIMGFNFHFTAIQTIWTLTLAGLLVLLIVLLGRERIRRFPWFTASIALLALRLLISKLLFGKLPPFTLNEILITLGDVLAVVSVMVAVEMARRAFVGLGRTQWIANTVGALVVAGFVVAIWGAWPAWKTLTAGSQIAVLRLMQLVAQKLDLLANVLIIELSLLVVLFGRRYGAGWRSHTQRILIGLSTAAISQLIVLGVWQLIALKFVPHSQAEYDKVIDLRDKIFNANGVVFVAVVVWWICSLWKDEPGANAGGAEVPVEEGLGEA
jgi:hypothetical protein